MLPQFLWSTQEGGSAPLRQDRFAILFEATKRLQDLQDEVQRLKAAQGELTGGV
jgi:hypothetical protein